MAANAERRGHKNTFIEIREASASHLAGRLLEPPSASESRNVTTERRGVRDSLTATKFYTFNKFSNHSYYGNNQKIAR